MSLKKFLEAGGLAKDWQGSGKLKSLAEMSDVAKRRHGYVDERGDFTELGASRLLPSDWSALEEANRIRKRLSKRG